MKYENIADEKIVPMNSREREHLAQLLADEPDDFTRLVEILYADGCEFPIQQASLMLRNTPGAASKLLEEAGAYRTLHDIMDAPVCGCGHPHTGPGTIGVCSVFTCWCKLWHEPNSQDPDDNAPDSEPPPAA